MSNPIIVACPAEQWTLVASATQVGTLNKNNTRTRYSYTYRETGGGAPPIAGNLADSVPWTTPQLWIAHPADIDVYVWAHDDAGAVEVEL